jgi:predicted nuclease with TOPRIM domain
MKLQVTYKEVLLHNQVQGMKAQEAVKSLAEDRDQLKEKLEEERKLNEENAERVTELEEKIEAFDNAIDWMEGETA